MAKGTVYSGIVWMPLHPDADLHGMLRVCIRDASFLEVRLKLERAGIPTAAGMQILRVWQHSQSHAEHQATERHYGELLACPLVSQYLKPENYKPIPKSLLRRKIS